MTSSARSDPGILIDLAAASSTAALLPHVAVCIPTFRREVGLRRTLESVARQDYRGTITIIVAENDVAEQRGLMTAVAFAPQSPHRLVTVVAPERGHSQACNAAFAAAAALSPPAEFIAMIDDDEAAEPDWLRKLVRAQINFDADVVNGPVIPAFEAEPEGWMRHGFFGTSIGRHGPMPIVLTSGNLLIRAQVVRDFLPEVFPNALGLSGGGDTDFAFRALRAGLRIAGAPDAIIRERIFVTRMSKEWVLQRAYRTGITNVHAQARNDPSMRGALLRIAKTVALFGVAILALSVTWFDEVRFLRARLMLARARGKLDGHRGRLFLEYSSIHGR